MSVTPSTAMLQERLDDLHSRGSLLTQWTVMAEQDWAAAAAPQIVDWAIRGWVRITDHEIRRIATPPTGALRPDERRFFDLLFTERDRRTPRERAPLPTIHPRTHEYRRIWVYMTGPVRHAIAEQVRDLGYVRFRPQAIRARLRFGGVLAAWALLAATPLVGRPPGMSGGLVVAVMVSAVMMMGLAIMSAPPAGRYRTERAQRLREEHVAFRAELEALVAGADPLPPDQASLTFYEHALPVAMLHGWPLAEQWEQRLREHHAGDTTRRSALLDGPTPASLKTFETLVHVALVLPEFRGVHT